MRHSKPSTALLLLVSAMAFSGCHTSHASSSAASLAKPSGAPSSAQSFAHRSKHSVGDSEFSVYHNPGYGISFRYPRNYLLLEPKLEPKLDPEQDPEQTPEQASIGSVDSELLLTPQSLDSDQPGALLVATVLIPDDAYPNTSFASGHLQFVVNPRATAESCRALVAPPDSPLPAAPHELFLQDIHFYWRDRGSSTPSILFAGREYAGFSGGRLLRILSPSRFHALRLFRPPHSRRRPTHAPGRPRQNPPPARKIRLLLPAPSRVPGEVSFQLLEKETKELKAQRDAYRTLANSATASLDPEQAQKAIEQSLNSNPEAARVLPRIFVHIRAASQRQRPRYCGRFSRKRVHRSGSADSCEPRPGRNTSEVFSSRGRGEAGKIAQAISDAGGPKAVIKLVSGYPNIRPRQYEIWFTADAL